MKNFLFFENQREELERLASIALDLSSNKSEGTEILIKKLIGISINTRYGELENIKFNNSGKFWITVYNQNRKGNASSTNLNKKNIFNTISAAINISNNTSGDQFIDIVDKDLLAFNPLDLDLFHPTTLDLDEFIKLSARAESAALSMDKRITNTEGGSFSYFYDIKIVGNSHGMLSSYFSTYYYLSSCVIAKDHNSMERDYAYTNGRSLNDLKNPELVGRECAKKVLSRLSSHKLSTTKSPVIFINEVATELFNHLADAIIGDAVYQQSTFLFNSIGKQIFPEWLTIEEHPHLLKGIASAPFDDEGVKTQHRNIVKDGILTQWLLNSYSARRLGLKSTGHANGEIYNWKIIGKELDITQMLKDMGTGLLISELIGHGVNNVTGDYSRGAFGFWVKNGEIQYPVSKITVAGNLKEMYRNIIAIGNDIEMHNKIQCGSVFLSEMVIAG